MLYCVTLESQNFWPAISLGYRQFYSKKICASWMVIWLRQGYECGFYVMSLKTPVDILQYYTVIAVRAYDCTSLLSVSDARTTVIVNRHVVPGCSNTPGD